MIEKRFRYVLDPVLKKHSWDLDKLRLEASRAQQVLTQKQEELGAITEIVNMLEDDLRQLNTEGRSLGIAHYQSMLSFLALKRDERALKTKEAEQAERIHTQILAQLIKVHRSIKGLEKHRAKREKQHDADCTRATIKSMDEIWLTRQRGSKP